MQYKDIDAGEAKLNYQMELIVRLLTKLDQEGCREVVEQLKRLK